MKRVRAVLLLLVLVGAVAAAYVYLNSSPTSLVLTGIVTTNDVVVSPQIAGQIRQLLVTEGDVVKKDQLLAVMRPDELQADSAFYAHSAEGIGSQVHETEAPLRFQERQTTDSIQQAEATLASTQAQQ